MDFTIDELTVPESLDGEDAHDFIAMADVRNAVLADMTGGTYFDATPAELLPNWRNRFEPKRGLLVRAGGRIVGRAILEWRPDAGSSTASARVEVLGEFRGRGIGSALYDGLLKFAREQRRPVLQAWAVHPDAPGDRLTASSGAGSVPANSSVVRFLTSRGFTLGQVERISSLVLPVDPEALRSLEDRAAGTAGSDYRVIGWAGRTPEEWLTDAAFLRTRMSTDAPMGGLDVHEDVWTEERVSASDDAAEDDPQARLIVAIEHVPTGRLVGFSELFVPKESDRPVTQGDTLVLREHRGHRLGALLKVANLRQLAEQFPGHPSVTTVNAEQNAQMLAVNEAVGFVPVAYEGAWQAEVSLDSAVSTVSPPRA